MSALLAHTAHLAVLATSRRRLGVDGERRLPLEPLPTPADADPASPAVALFTDRAAAVRPDTALHGAALEAVCELCRRLDGLPLAIELAAARSISRSPGELLTEMTDHLDRLADRGRVVDRHRSIDAVVGWSYDLLDSATRAQFAHLAVFAGSWSAAAAAAVAGADVDEVVEQLSLLVEHSLVTARDLDGQTRFSMLEPIHQHAHARLREHGLLDDVRARHAAWAVSWVEAAEVGLRGPDEIRWRTLFDEEFANLRRAQQWCLEHDPDGALRLAAALYWPAYWSAPSEVFSWVDQSVEAHGGVPHPRRAGAFATAALGAWRKGDLDRARTLAEHGTELTHAGDPAVSRLAWQALGDVEVLTGRFDRALATYDQAITLSRRAGDDYQAAADLLNRALALGYAGREDAATQDVADAARLLPKLGNPTSEAFCLFVSGEILVESAPSEAVPNLRRSLELARLAGNRFITGIAGLSALSCAARLGNPASVLSDYTELIDHWHRAGAWTQLWITIRTLIEALTRLGHDAAATVLDGALTASRSASPVAGTDAARLAEALATLRTRLGPQQFARLHAQGASLDDEEAVARALAYTKNPLDSVGGSARPRNVTVTLS